MTEAVRPRGAFWKWVGRFWRLIVLGFGLLMVGVLGLLSYAVGDFDAYTTLGRIILQTIYVAAIVGMILSFWRRTPGLALVINVSVLVTASAVFWIQLKLYDEDQTLPTLETTWDIMHEVDGLVEDLGGTDVVAVDTDVARVLPLLDALRRLPAGNMDPTQTAPSFGLLDDVPLARASRAAYFAALDQHYLSRILLILEGRMRANSGDDALLFNDLKAYLMLGGMGPMDTDFVQQWMGDIFWLRYPGPEFAETRGALAQHLSTLLNRPFKSWDLDDALVTWAQERLSEVPLAQRTYEGVINSAFSNDLLPFRLSDVGGPNTARVLRRASGAAWTDGVPGIFTRDGFYLAFMAQLPKASRDALSGAWVMGESAQFKVNEMDVDDLSNDVLRLYVDDYIAQYDALLGDIDVIPAASVAQAAEIADVLSGPASPLGNILRAIGEETDLTRSPSLEGGEITGALSQINPLNAARLATGALRNATEESIAAGVAERFTWLHDLMREGNDAPSDLAVFSDRLADLSQDLSNLATRDPDASFAARDSLLDGRPDENRLAPYRNTALERWTNQILTTTADSSLRAEMNAVWQEDVLPLCTAVGFSYPFDRNARSDIPVEDFDALFGPRGLIDLFYEDYLAPHIDTSGDIWQLRPESRRQIALSDTVLRQMQNAAIIRDTFFPGGGFGFDTFVSVANQDQRITDVVLSLDTFDISLPPMEALAEPVFWPNGAEVTTLTLYTAEKEPITLRGEGPWALFRILEAADIRPDPKLPGTDRATFSLSGLPLALALEPDTRQSPYTLPALSSFSCPSAF